jgi:hypothetical protein
MEETRVKNFILFEVYDFWSVINGTEVLEQILKEGQLVSEN